MWIRSQNSLELLKVEGFYVSGSSVYDALTEGTLGNYRSKERALEVLDEIEGHLNSYKKGNREVFEMPEK